MQLYHWIGRLLAIAVVTDLGFASIAAASPASNAYVNFARAGGIFSSRTATFRVPDETTITDIGNGLRLYEAHVARMIELTHFFCQEQNREPNYRINWNYEAANGHVFMGQYEISCSFAEQVFQTFGIAGQEPVTIHYVGRPERPLVQTLNLNSNNADAFTALAGDIPPECIEAGSRICPGDRLD